MVRRSLLLLFRSYALYIITNISSLYLCLQFPVSGNKGLSQGTSHHVRSSRLLLKLDNSDSQQKIRSTIRSTQTDAISQLNVTNKSNLSTIDPNTQNTIILLLTSQFILFLGVGAVIPIIPLYSQSIGLSSTSNGVVISAPAIALLLCSRFSASYADMGRKPPMLLGMAFIAVSDLGTAFANSLPVLVVARLGLGLGRGYAEAGERGMLADLANRAPEEWRGRGLALQQAVVAVGVALGASGGGILVQRFGVRIGFFCVSVAAVICLGLYMLLPETVGDASNAKVTEEIDASRHEIVDNGSDAWIQLLATSPTWRSLALCQCGVSFGYACKIAIIPVLASDFLPGGIAAAGLLLSAAGLAGLLGASIGGYLTDQYGSRFAASSAGLLSGLSFILVPFGLSLNDMIDSTSIADSVLISVNAVGGLGPATFIVLVLLWSIGASAQGKSTTGSSGYSVVLVNCLILHHLTIPSQLQDQLLLPSHNSRLQ